MYSANLAHADLVSSSVGITADYRILTAHEAFDPQRPAIARSQPWQLAGRIHGTHVLTEGQAVRCQSPLQFSTDSNPQASLVTNARNDATGTVHVALALRERFLGPVRICIKLNPML